MNYVLITSFLLSISGAVFAMDGSRKVTVAQQEELCAQFKKAGLLRFAQSSSFIKRIAGKECDPAGIEFAIKNAVVNYQQKLSLEQQSISHLQDLESRVKKIIIPQE